MPFKIKNFNRRIKLSAINLKHNPMNIEYEFHQNRRIIFEEMSLKTRIFPIRLHPILFSLKDLLDKFLGAIISDKSFLFIQFVINLIANAIEEA